MSQALATPGPTRENPDPSRADPGEPWPVLVLQTGCGTVGKEGGAFGGHVKCFIPVSLVVTVKLHIETQVH